jgi:dTDP-4-dehydrorhamnose reductase
MSEFARPILLTGATGQVGWELARALAPLGPVVAVDHERVDLADSDELRRFVRDVEPAAIVNAAAHTAVDRAESERDLAFAVNAEAPGVLADEAARIGGVIVHYSTDYVYSGDSGTPYVEGDPANPLSVYGASKFEGDCRVIQSGAAHLIFRTSWVYAARGHNFLRTMMRLSRERESLRVVSDQIGAPTPAFLIADVTAQVLGRFRVSGRFEIPQALGGLYHLATAGSTSWHGFAQSILANDPTSGEQRCREIVAIATSEYPTPARRPSSSLMSIDKIEGTFGFRLPSWENALRLVMRELMPAPRVPNESPVGTNT